MTRNLQVGQWTLTLDGMTIHDVLSEEADLFTEYEFRVETGDEQALLVDPLSGQSFEVMHCRENEGGLFLEHLDVPTGYRSEGFGKLGLAFFYYLSETQGYGKFAMKFGGGDQSAKFLEHMGFDSRYIHTAQNSAFEGESVLVGEFEGTADDWTLRPISISKFPTSFFELY